jgi:flagellar protein FliO/FliZ
VLLKLSRKRLDSNESSSLKGLALMFTWPRLAKVLMPIVLLWLSASGVVHAESNGIKEDSLGLDSPPNIGNIITVIVVLILIIGLIVILIRFLAHKNNSWFSSRSIRHLGGVGLGQNKSVQMVKVGNSLYVVGVGENISLLDKIDEQEEIDAIFQSLNTTSTIPGKGILAYVSKALNLRREKPLPLDDNDPTAASSFQEIFHSKMQQVTERRQNLKKILENDNKSEEDRS